MAYFQGMDAVFLHPEATALRSKKEQPSSSERNASPPPNILVLKLFCWMILSRLPPWLKPPLQRGNKTFLGTQPLQKFASAAPTKAIQEKKEARTRRTPSLAAGDAHQLLRVISSALQILSPKIPDWSKQNPRGASLPALEEVHQASFLKLVDSFSTDTRDNYFSVPARL